MAAESAALNIPTVVWSGIVAASISLAGVVISNLSTSKRLRTQLAHDAKEKLKDRLASLRREVYLALLSDLGAMQGHLGSLAFKDPTSPDFLAPIQKANEQLSKVLLVGERETIEHASELSTLYTEALFALIVAARPMHEARIEINLADQSYNDFLKESERTTKEITVILESGNFDDDRFRALERSRNDFQKLTSKYAHERSKAWDTYNSLQAGFLETVKDQISKISSTQAKFLSAMKNEIGVEVDASFLITHFEPHRERIDLAARSLLSEILPPSA